MKEGIIFFTLISAIFGAMIYLAILGHEDRKEKIATARAECIASGESKYICEAYVSSMIAAWKADDASAIAAANLGVVLGNQWKGR